MNTQPTEFFFDYDYLRDEYEDAKARFISHTPDKAYETEIYHITDRYLKKAKTNYVKFGPYWWGVKEVMHRNGFKGYQGDDDLVIREAYTIRNPTSTEIDDYATLLAAWLFMQHYDDTYFQGNRHFSLWNEGDDYFLLDIDWEHSLD